MEYVFGLTAAIFLCFIIKQLYLLRRNQWVYIQRMKIIKSKGSKCLDDYMSYDEMMYLCWVWDIEKLRLDNKPNIG